ncbi:hypothetical protein [uncultured Psychroserpens sp.]|uniref:hypothetical protein n=1 Tax=uncultured Psychroserpens sp. TaxID=255436 RepID=UPI00262E7FE8|nr:hypothetical protein [uncultured Psychroserpens sp.]
MKYLLILIIVLFSCNNKKSIINESKVQESKQNYKVFKVDSIGSFYLIYLNKGNLNYKVISEMQSEKKANELIEVGKEYSLSLSSVFNQKLKIKDKKVRAVPLMVDCIQFEKNINICKEKELGINDLHYTSDLSGLHLIVDKDSD